MIRAGAFTHEVEGRRAAVRKAKDVSANTGRIIGLERSDGRVKMQFQRGSLQTYRYETQESGDR